MASIMRHLMKSLRNLFGSQSASSWSEMNVYIRKLHIVENAEENAIAICCPPGAAPSNNDYQPPPIPLGFDTDGLRTLVTDFNGICEAMTKFIATVSEQEAYEACKAQMVIDAIDCVLSTHEM